MRIATFQCPAIADDAAGACKAIIQYLRWAEQEAIDLVLLPEAFLLGHSYDPETISARAQETSCAVLGELCRQISTSPATLVVGAFEWAAPDIFNSAFVIVRGHISGRYTKAYPNEPGVAAGSDFPIFVRSGIRYGINICNDANHADAAEQIACQQADLILFSLNNMLPSATAERWREKSMLNLINRARQTGCWIASSDVTGEFGDLLSYGCTAIIAPDGQVVAQVPELEKGVAVYEIPDRKPGSEAG